MATPGGKRPLSAPAPIVGAAAVIRTDAMFAHSARSGHRKPTRPECLIASILHPWCSSGNRKQMKAEIFGRKTIAPWFHRVPAPRALSLSPPHINITLSSLRLLPFAFLLPPCLLSRFVWHARRAQDKCAPSIMSARRARQGRPRCTHGRQGHTRAPSEGHTREPLSSWARRCPPETRWRRRQCSVLSSAHATTGGGASPRPGHEPRTPWQRLFLQTS